MRDSVSIAAVEAAARSNNQPGPDHMNCGESVIAALWDAFEPDFPRSVVAAGAGMGAGIGGSGCICGALAGGVAFLGLMTGTKGRTKPHRRRAARRLLRGDGTPHALLPRAHARHGVGEPRARRRLPGQLRARGGRRGADTLPRARGAGGGIDRLASRRTGST